MLRPCPPSATSAVALSSGEPLRLPLKTREGRNNSISAEPEPLLSETTFTVTEPTASPARRHRRLVPGATPGARSSWGLPARALPAAPLRRGPRPPQPRSLGTRGQPAAGRGTGRPGRGPCRRSSRCHPAVRDPAPGRRTPQCRARARVHDTQSALAQPPAPSRAPARPPCAGARRRAVLPGQPRDATRRAARAAQSRAALGGKAPSAEAAEEGAGSAPRRGGLREEVGEAGAAPGVWAVGGPWSGQGGSQWC